MYRNGPPSRNAPADESRVARGGRTRSTGGTFGNKDADEDNGKEVVGIKMEVDDGKVDDEEDWEVDEVNAGERGSRSSPLLLG